jgi:SAM-dependent methyltransferase
MVTGNVAPYNAFAYYYDLLGWSEFTEIVYPFLENFINRMPEKPETFLDLACGTGTLACRLSEQNIKVLGVDISPEMIEVASSKTCGNGYSPEFQVGDITNLNLRRKFDMAGCFFDSLNHLKSGAEIKRAFQYAHKNLSEGGWFIFDMVTRLGLENWKDYYNSSRDTFYVMQEARFSTSKNKAQVKIEAFVNDAENGAVHIRERFEEICIPNEIIYRHLNEAGFIKIIAEPFPPADNVENADRILFYARK